MEMFYYYYTKYSSYSSRDKKRCFATHGRVVLLGSASVRLWFIQVEKDVDRWSASPGREVWEFLRLLLLLLLLAAVSTTTTTTSMLAGDRGLIVFFLMAGESMPSRS